MSLAEVPSPQPGRAELVDRFAELLGGLKRRAAAAMPPEVREQMAGATPHQLEALTLVSASPNGITMHEIAEHQNCAMSTATALVDRLEKQGLVERRSDPDDRRVVRIVSTDQAQSFIACAREGKRGMAEKLLAPLNDQELREFVTLMSKIISEAGDGKPSVGVVSGGE
jgi:DNA-binding MarR family transcriptional regulator